MTFVDLSREALAESLTSAPLTRMLLNLGIGSALEPYQSEDLQPSLECSDVLSVSASDSSVSRQPAVPRRKL